MAERKLKIPCYLDQDNARARLVAERVRHLLPEIMADVDRSIARWAAEVHMTPAQWSEHWVAITHVHYDDEGRPYEYVVKALPREQFDRENAN